MFTVSRLFFADKINSNGAEQKIPKFKNTIYKNFTWSLVDLLLNGLFFPNIGKNRIITTDYVSFIEKVDEGRVKDVVIKDNQLYFTVDDNGKTINYKTGEVNDPQ